MGCNSVLEISHKFTPKSALTAATSSHLGRRLNTVQRPLQGVEMDPEH